MDAQDRPRSILPASAILVLAGLGGFYLYDQPYLSLRPGSPPGVPRGHGTSQDVDARLWEDPFAAIRHERTTTACRSLPAARERDEEPDKGGQETTAAEANSQALQKAAAHQMWQLGHDVRAAGLMAGKAERKVVLVPALVPGAPYAEEAEERRRLRYAVLSGLSAAGYVARDSDRIGFIETCWNSDGRLDQRTGRRIAVPYEWFEPDRLSPADLRGLHEAVLVLWLDESELSTDPWGAIDDLLRYLVGYCPPQIGRDDPCALSQDSEDVFTYRVIGPSRSDTLLAMLGQRRRESTPDPRAAAPRNQAGGNEASVTEVAQGSPGPDSEEGDAEEPEGGGEGPPLDQVAQLVDEGEMLAETGSPFDDPSGLTDSLLLAARLYLDHPELLFGPSDSRRGDLQLALLPHVRAALPLLRRVLGEGGPAADAQVAEALEPLASVLRGFGWEVEDVDSDWARSVSRLWIGWWLEEGGEDWERGEGRRTEADRELSPAAELAEDLCRSLPVNLDCATSLPLTTRGLATACDRTPQGGMLAENLTCDLVSAWTKLKKPQAFLSLGWWTVDLSGRLTETVDEWGKPKGQKLDGDGVAAAIDSWIRRQGEVLFGRFEPRASVLPSLRIYSNRATAPASLLLAAADSPVAWTGDWNAALASFLGTRDQVQLVSVVGRDDQLALVLVDELTRRGIDLAAPAGKDHMALVGEWDTFYGRALPLTLEAAVQYRRLPEGSQDLNQVILGILEGRLRPPTRVERFNYLRGLDGSVASERESGGDSEPEPRETPSASSRAMGGSTVPALSPWRRKREVERATGDVQFDYMRRLADQLSRYDSELRRSGEALRVIGVVGTDAYDKLVVLQALREQFPQTLFFTTDLDVRLLHPADYQWNRNLLVASSFGLSLDKALQQRIPPFRDSYQTATFLAVQLALSEPAAAGGAVWPPVPGVEVEASGLPRTPGIAQAALLGPGPRAESPSSSSGSALAHRDRLALVHHSLTGGPAVVRPGPRLYEVGRSGEYDITPEHDGLGLHPDRRPGRPGRRIVEGLAGLSLMVGVLLVPIVPSLRRFTLGRRVDTTELDRFLVNGLTTLVGLTILVYGLLIYVDTQSGRGEPFELFEGISLWPTEGVRLLAAILAFSLLGLGMLHLRECERKIAETYRLPAGGASDRPSFWKLWWTGRRAGRANGAAESEERRQSDSGWLTYTALLRRVSARMKIEAVSWWRLRKELSINEWRRDDERKGLRNRTGMEIPADGKAVWNRYSYLGRISHRFTRFLPVAALYSFFSFELISLLGEPHKPFRGNLSRGADIGILTIGVIGMVVLVFFVVDATRLCERFIHALADRPTKWPSSLLSKFAGERKLDRRDVPEFLDLLVIADRTEAVGRLIVYPFIVLFLMIVSRAPFFDNWNWPFSLMLILGLLCAYALMCAVVLRRAAEGARRATLVRLRGNLYEAIGEASDGSAFRASQIRLLIEEVQELRRGAFAHWSHHPVVKAVLLPFGGVGAVVLFELLSSLGL